MGCRICNHPSVVEIQKNLFWALPCHRPSCHDSLFAREESEFGFGPEEGAFLPLHREDPFVDGKIWGGKPMKENDPSENPFNPGPPAAHRIDTFPVDLAGFPLYRKERHRLGTFLPGFTEKKTGRAHLDLPQCSVCGIMPGRMKGSPSKSAKKSHRQETIREIL